MSHFSDAHAQWLEPPDAGDQLCATCQHSNLDNAAHDLAVRCETNPLICVGCCLHSDTPCAECLPATAAPTSLPAIPMVGAAPPFPSSSDPTNHDVLVGSQPLLDGEPLPAGDYRVVGIELCAGCDKAFATDNLTRVRSARGDELRCWPCTEELRDLGLSA